MKPIFTFPPPRRLAEQFFLLKTEKPVQTNGATAKLRYARVKGGVIGDHCGGVKGSQ
jgi:hypothetical protein